MSNVEIVSGAGDAGMRKVFKAAHDGTTAYVGAAAPEKTSLPNDWRRFVDLAETLGGAAMHAQISGTIDYREPSDEARSAWV